MGTVETRDAGETMLLRREETKIADGLDVVQEASEESFPASDAPSSTPVVGAGSPLQEQVLRQCGRFTLARGIQGFCWILTSNSGSVWYWHSEVELWYANRCVYPTEVQATAGLEAVLAGESESALKIARDPAFAFPDTSAATPRSST